MAAEILTIKIGLVESVTFVDGTTLESAIRKKPVELVRIHELGAEGNDVGLKAHHGGPDKALFFMADQTLLVRILTGKALRFMVRILSFQN